MSADRQAAREHLLKVLQLAIQALNLLGYKTVGTYHRHLWSACLQFYRDGDVAMFLDKFIVEIREQLTRAFNEGARSVGMDPDEYNQYDRDHLQSWIDNEYNFVLGLAQDIEDLRMSGANEEMFRRAIHWRINVWANRYNEVVNEARVYFGGKIRLEWVRGPTAKPCDTCIALGGTVAFATEWDQSGFRPQHPPNPLLKCEGWGCQCKLLPTDRRRSPRALDKLTALAVGGFL